MDKELRNKIAENKILTHHERAKIISDLESYEDLRDKIDKTIEEINDLNLSWVASHYEDRFYGFQQEVLEILKRNIGE